MKQKSQQIWASDLSQLNTGSYNSLIPGSIDQTKKIAPIQEIDDIIQKELEIIEDQEHESSDTISDDDEINKNGED